MHIFIAPSASIYFYIMLSLTLICLGGSNLFPLYGFLKNVPSIERMEPWFFVTFNIISKYIFPESFIEFRQVVQKKWRNYLSILVIFLSFPPFFWNIWYYLVTKKPMTSTDNRWCQHFFPKNGAQPYYVNF